MAQSRKAPKVVDQRPKRLPSAKSQRTADDDGDVEAIMNAIDESDSYSSSVPRSATLSFLKRLQSDIQDRIETIQGEMDRDGDEDGGNSED